MSIPSDLKSCRELIISQQKMIDELQIEQEKLRKLLAQMLNGNRSEKRIFSGPDQKLLPFESEEEFQVAQAEAEAEAETIIEKYTVQRHARKKKPRNESLPSHLERVEQIVEALHMIKAHFHIRAATLAACDPDSDKEGKAIKAGLTFAQVLVPEGAATVDSVDGD